MEILKSLDSVLEAERLAGKYLEEAKRNRDALILEGGEKGGTIYALEKEKLKQSIIELEKESRAKIDARRKLVSVEAENKKHEMLKRVMENKERCFEEVYSWLISKYTKE